MIADDDRDRGWPLAYELTFWQCCQELSHSDFRLSTPATSFHAAPERCRSVPEDYMKRVKEMHESGGGGSLG